MDGHIRHYNGANEQRRNLIEASPVTMQRDVKQRDVRCVFSSGELPSLQIVV